MRISTKGRYALRLMLDLARHPDQNVSIKEVASRQLISHKYLEQIIIQLAKAHLVKSVRGPQGGYSLTALPHEITCGIVLRVMEGSLAPVACVEEGGQACEQAEECDTHYLWQRLKEAVESVVDDITLQDLLDNTLQLPNPN